MRITLTIPSMSSGGAEHVMSILANNWAQNHDVTLITVTATDGDFYPLDKNIHRIGLGKAAMSGNVLSATVRNLNRIFEIRKRLKQRKPDVTISFLDRMNVVTLLAAFGLNIPVIISERIDPRQLSPGRGWIWLRRNVYRLASAVVVLTEELKQVLADIVPAKKLHVIPNPAMRKEAMDETQAEVTIPSPFVAAMGRLVPQKGFDMLLQAFHLCSHAEQWSLVIMGEGEERQKLMAIIRELGLENRVFMPGRLRRPDLVMSKAEFFVLSSRFEGFPNAVIEAMACGLPVISFDCPTGPNVIIHDGKDGILVPREDITALARAMQSLISDASQRNQLGIEARKVVNNFSESKIMEKWQDLIRQVIAQ